MRKVVTSWVATSFRIESVWVFSPHPQDINSGMLGIISFTQWSTTLFFVIFKSRNDSKQLKTEFVNPENKGVGYLSPPLSCSWINRWLLDSLSWSSMNSVLPLQILCLCTIITQNPAIMVIPAVLKSISDNSEIYKIMWIPLFNLYVDNRCLYFDNLNTFRERNSIKLFSSNVFKFFII